MFKELFKEIAAAIPGFRAAAVVGSDGIEIECYVQESLPHEVLSAELNGMLRNLARMREEVGIGAFQEAVLRTKQENILLLTLSDEMFLLLIMGAEHPTGRARYEIQRQAYRFLAILQ